MDQKAPGQALTEADAEQIAALSSSEYCEICREALHNALGMCFECLNHKNHARAVLQAFFGDFTDERLELFDPPTPELSLSAQSRFQGNLAALFSQATSMNVHVLTWIYLLDIIVDIKVFRVERSRVYIIFSHCS